MDPLPRTPTRAVPTRAPRVYLVEGDAVYASQLASALNARGLATRVMLGAQFALERIAQDRPDLVVLCAELPDSSGYVACSRLKRDEKTASIPIVFTSAQADTATFEAHQRLWVHADAYLRKPYDAQALLEKAAKLVALPPGALGPARSAASAEKPSREDEVLEQGFVYLGGCEETEALDERLVSVAAAAPAASTAAAAATEDVLEDGFEYLGGAAEEEALDERLVTVVADHPLAASRRTAPGRWKLPAGIGATAA